MNNVKMINSLLKKHHGVITTTICRNHNIPNVYLTRMVRDGQLKRLTRGIYTNKEGSYDEDYFFQVRFQKCIYSYQSALYFQGLSDQVPFTKEITLYKGYNPHTIPSDIKVHFVNKNIYELGITTVLTAMGNKIKVYDKERTICDLIKHRNLLDVEMFRKALKMYLKQNDKDINRLYEYAEKLGVLKEMNKIMELFFD